MTSTSSSNWVLYSPVAPGPEEVRTLEPWVRLLAANPRVNVGDLESGVVLKGVAPKHWVCAVDPDYVLPHTLVAGIASADGRYAMLFMSGASEEFHRQTYPTAVGLLGYFKIRLVEPVLSVAAIEKNLRHAIDLLCAHSFL